MTFRTFITRSDHGGAEALRRSQPARLSPSEPRAHIPVDEGGGRIAHELRKNPKASRMSRNEVGHQLSHRSSKVVELGSVTMIKDQLHAPSCIPDYAVFVLRAEASALERACWTCFLKAGQPDECSMNNWIPPTR